MPAPVLRVTDGTEHVYLHGRSGFSLRDWTPLRSGLKGGGVWSDSPLADGRRLRLYKRENAIETFELVPSHRDFDMLARELQDLERLLVKALDYHQSPWQTEAVWLEARGPDESNTRYALIHTYALPQDDNPYATPVFTDYAKTAMDDVTLVIERGPWLSLPPGEQRCIEIEGAQDYEGTMYGREAGDICAVLTATEGCIMIEGAPVVDSILLEDLSGCIALEGGTGSGSPWPEVYVANKHTQAQLTSLQYNDGGAWSGDLLGGYPYDLLPAAPIANDYVAFCCEDGPFCSLVFDLDPAGAGAAVTWQYSTAAGVWTTFAADQVTDNTEGFTRAGVSGVHWIQQDDWTDETYNGATGWWVRALLTGVLTTPTQVDRDVYSVLWPNFLVDYDQVVGDIPGLSHFRVYPKSPDEDTALAFDRLMAGLRSTSRGASFTPYLNVSEEQNPDGVFVTLEAAGAFLEVSDAPTGWCGSWVALPFGPPDVETYASFLLNSEAYVQYRGTYHAFCRAKLISGDVNEVTAHLRVGSNVAGTFRELWESHTRPAMQAVVPGPPGEFFELLDLGRITLPPTTPLDVYSLLEVRLVFTNPTAAAIDFEAYDLILMPVDEWSGMFVEVAADTEVTYEQALDVDSVRDPRLYIRVQSTEAGNDNSIVPYQPQANGPAIWQANSAQRLWFLAAIGAGGDIVSSNPAICSGAWAFAVDRYQSHRGDR